MMNSIKPIEIGKIKLGPDYPVAMVAEGCDSHNGSLEKAKEMAHAAKEAGADIIKFQLHLPEEEMSKPEMEITSKDMFAKWGSLYGFIESNLLSPEAHKELMDYCKQIGIQYWCTPFSLKAAQLLNEMGAEAFKIGSGETEDLPFIEEAAKMGKPMVISTGMSTWDEIFLTVDRVKTLGAPLALAHCISMYSPKRADQLQLGLIQELATRFGVPVGLSDHTEPEGVTSRTGLNVSQQAQIFAAVAYGACFVEKHFTLDRSQPDADSKFSLDPTLLKELIQTIRAAEEACGRERKVFEEEKPVWIWAKRSLVAVQDIPAGTKLTREMFTSKRPGIGIRSKLYPEVIGKAVRRDIGAGKLINWGDIE